MGVISGRDKLVQSKIKWAEERRLIQAEPAERRRLPPGQRLVNDLPVLDLGVRPNLRLEDVTLEVSGLVRRPARWTGPEVKRLGSAAIAADIHCVTGWSSYDVAWTGVPTVALARLAQPLPAARHVLLKSHDAYVTSLPIEDFLEAKALVAWALDDRPLSRDHGGPLRLVVPHLYFWKSPKWLRSIRFVEQPFRGTWEARGYHDRGDPWRQERYR